MSGPRVTGGATVTMRIFTSCLKKNCAFLFLSELRQIYTNLNKFWYVECRCQGGCIVWCINIFHLTWPTSPPYLVKLRCSKLLHNLEMHYLQQTIWRLNELDMVYLAKLLVVMRDRLKIVTILARNMPRTRTQALRRRRVSRVSLAPGKRRCCVLDAQGRRPVKTQKNSSWDNLRISCSGLWVRRLSRQFAPSLLHQIWAVWL